MTSSHFSIGSTCCFCWNLFLFQLRMSSVLFISWAHDQIYYNFIYHKTVTPRSCISMCSYTYNVVRWAQSEWIWNQYWRNWRFSIWDWIRFAFYSFSCQEFQGCTSVHLFTLVSASTEAADSFTFELAQQCHQLLFTWH